MNSSVSCGWRSGWPVSSGKQVLLRDVGDVLRLRVLGEQMVVGLLLVRPDLLGDRQPPLLGVVELGIDVEDDAAERIEAVAHDLPHRESWPAVTVPIVRCPSGPHPFEGSAAAAVNQRSANSVHEVRHSDRT